MNVFLAILPVSENRRYNHEKAISRPTQIPVKVNQCDYNAGGDSKRYRCVFADGQILWVPLDALRGAHGESLTDEILDTHIDEERRAQDLLRARATG